VLRDTTKNTYQIIVYINMIENIYIDGELLYRKGERLFSKMKKSAAGDKRGLKCKDIELVRREHT